MNRAMNDEAANCSLGDHDGEFTSLPQGCHVHALAKSLMAGLCLTRYPLDVSLGTNLARSIDGIEWEHKPQRWLNQVHQLVMRRATRAVVPGFGYCIPGLTPHGDLFHESRATEAIVLLNQWHATPRMYTPDVHRAARLEANALLKSIDAALPSHLWKHRGELELIVKSS